jgi:hypothetical protein
MNYRVSHSSGSECPACCLLWCCGCVRGCVRGCGCVWKFFALSQVSCGLGCRDPGSPRPISRLALPHTDSLVVLGCAISFSFVGLRRIELITTLNLDFQECRH